MLVRERQQESFSAEFWGLLHHHLCALLVCRKNSELDLASWSRISKRGVKQSKRRDASWGLLTLYKMKTWYSFSVKVKINVPTGTKRRGFRVIASNMDNSVKLWIVSKTLGEMMYINGRNDSAEEPDSHKWWGWWICKGLKRLLAKLSLMSALCRFATSTPNGCLMFVSCQHERDQHWLSWDLCAIKRCSILVGNQLTDSGGQLADCLTKSMKPDLLVRGLAEGCINLKKPDWETWKCTDIGIAQ